MAQAPTEQDLRKTATIIWGALLAGLITFMAVASIARPTLAVTDPGMLMVLTLVANALAVVQVAASRLVPRFMKRREGVTPDQHALTRTIVAAALCDGAGLFCVVVWMVTGTQWIYAALGLALLGLAACYPGEGRWEALGGSPS
jgi:hypothetical protein